MSHAKSSFPHNIMGDDTPQPRNNAGKDDTYIYKQERDVYIFSLEVKQSEHANSIRISQRNKYQQLLLVLTELWTMNLISYGLKQLWLQ